MSQQHLNDFLTDARSCKINFNERSSSLAPLIKWLRAEKDRARPTTTVDLFHRAKGVFNGGSLEKYRPALRRLASVWGTTLVYPDQHHEALFEQAYPRALFWHGVRQLGNVAAILQDGLRVAFSMCPIGSTNPGASDTTQGGNPISLAVCKDVAEDYTSYDPDNLPERVPLKPYLRLAEARPMNQLTGQPQPRTKQERKAQVEAQMNKYRDAATLMRNVHHSGSLLRVFLPADRANNGNKPVNGGSPNRDHHTPFIAGDTTLFIDWDNPGAVRIHADLEGRYLLRGKLSEVLVQNPDAERTRAILLAIRSYDPTLSGDPLRLLPYLKIAIEKGEIGDSTEQEPDLYPCRRDYLDV